MRKEFVVIAAVVAVGLVGYLVWQGKQQEAAINTSAPQNTATTAPAQTAAPATPPAAAPQNAPAPAQPAPEQPAQNSAPAQQ